MSTGNPSLLSRRPYALYLTGRSCGTLANTSQAVIIAWQVYEAARLTMSVAEAAFVVGMIGLAQFLPLFALTLVVGEAADRHDRRAILTLCYLAQLLTSVGLALHAAPGAALWPIFALSAVFGSARAFFLPAASALGPMLVPPHLLPRAVATNALVAQIANICGPALGGLLCAASPVIGYAVCVGLYAVSVACTLLIRADTRPAVEPGRSRVAQIREGLGYVWGNKLVLGAISLDLFAVLLGGATGLLPVFARDVLHVGPQGFGVLRGAPAVGALLVAGYLSVRPIRRRTGRKMFAAVGVFGLMTLAFTFPESSPLSVACLAVLGGADIGVGVHRRSTPSRRYRDGKTPER